MSHPFETIPPSSENLQFPGGDITERNEMKACVLLDKLSAGDTGQRTRNLKGLRQHEIPFWENTTGQGSVWRGFKLLAEFWGKTRLPFEEDRGEIILRLGFQYSVAFLRSCQLLPTNFHDFSEEMFNMTTYDADAQQFFSDQAWAGMQESHPKLYGTMDPLTRLVADTFELSDESSLDLLRAGIVFPYIMASTTRMNGYMQSALKHEVIPRPEAHRQQAED